MHIVILSASVRQDRNSHRIASYFHRYIAHHHLASAEIVDLLSYNFPVFHERLQYTANPREDVLDFQRRIVSADGIVLVTPEYNGGYPASLKNAIDLLYPEWQRKPIAIATISSGAFGGSQVLTSLVFSLWKIGAWVVPARFQVPKVEENYDEQGNPKNKEAADKNARSFLDELFWCITANMRMKEADQ